MSQIAPAAGNHWLVRLLGQPLGLPHFALAAAVAVLATTLYCQLYCAIAFQIIPGTAMPLSASFAWAITAVMPWVTCLELAKRRSTWPPSPQVRGTMIGMLFALAAATSIILELGLDQLIGVHHTRPLTMQIASQLPAAAITAGLLYLGPRLSGRAPRGAAPVTEPLAEVIALSPSILWIEAAGNYVEVHTDRSVSLHRTTMRELEGSLDKDLFRRIHRSVIVNVTAIASRAVVGGCPAVRLVDGTVHKIGSRYKKSGD